MNKPYLSASEYFCNRFGTKVYKLSLSASDSCPNRDKSGNGGCIFCLNGSGDFSADISLPVDEQIEKEKMRISDKFSGGKYIAYFGSYTNTYGDLEHLEQIFTTVAKRKEIVALSIATRPDCLGEDVLAMLERLTKIKPLFVELGLQTSNEQTAGYINRGYPTECYDKAVADLHSIGINVITHIILGLPFEDCETMLNTVRYVINAKSDGIKLQLLHVLKGTRLAEDYRKGLFEVLTMDEYIDILQKILQIIPKDTVVHRLTGDGAKKHLIAPLWSGDKKRVLNEINRKIIQGKSGEKPCKNLAL